MGGEFQSFDGLSVTDPVYPPEGVRLQLRRIKWSDIKALEWDVLPANATPEDRRQFKTKVLYVDGRSESLFAWIPMRDNGRSKLFPCNMLIVGKMELGGKQQDISIGRGEREAQSCEDVDFVRLEFER